MSNRWACRVWWIEIEQLKDLLFSLLCGQSFIFSNLMKLTSVSYRKNSIKNVFEKKSSSVSHVLLFHNVISFPSKRLKNREKQINEFKSIKEIQIQKKYQFRFSLFTFLFYKNCWNVILKSRFFIKCLNHKNQCRGNPKSRFVSYLPINHAFKSFYFFKHFVSRFVFCDICEILKFINHTMLAGENSKENQIKTNWPFPVTFQPWPCQSRVQFYPKFHNIYITPQSTCHKFTFLWYLEKSENHIKGSINHVQKTH